MAINQKMMKTGWMFSTFVFLFIGLILFAVMTQEVKWTDAPPIFLVIIGILVLFIFIVFASARAEVIEAMKVFWAQITTQGKFAKMKFIMPDNRAVTLLLRVKGLVYEYKDKTFFINPKIYITEKGIKTFYFVLNNAFAHNFREKPEDIIHNIYEEQKKLDKMVEVQGEKHVDFSSYIHNIYDEAYRIDMNLLNETLLNAQLAKKGLLDKLLKMFQSKNLLIGVAIIAIASIIAAASGFMIMGHLKDVPLCQVGGAVINA